MQNTRSGNLQSYYNTTKEDYNPVTPQKLNFKTPVQHYSSITIADKPTASSGSKNDNNFSAHRQKLNIYQRSKQEMIGSAQKRSLHQSIDFSDYSGNKNQYTTAYKTNISEKSQERSVDRFPIEEIRKEESLRNPIEVIQLQKRIVNSQIELDQIQKSIKELNIKYEKSSKVVQKLREKSLSVDKDIAIYSELKSENDELKRRFKDFVKEKEEIKMKMKNLKNLSIKGNFDVDDQLNVKIQLIKSLEVQYYKVAQDIVGLQSTTNRMKQKFDFREDNTEENLKKKLQLQQQNQQYKERIQDLESKLYSGVYSVESLIKEEERFRRFYRQKSSILSLKLSLKKIIAKNCYQDCFKAIKNQSMKMKSVNILRKVFSEENNKHKRIDFHSAFMKWQRYCVISKIYDERKYQKAVQQQVQSPILKFFNLWRTAYIKKMDQKQQAKVGITQFINALNLRINKKSVTYAFSIWKSLMQMQNRGIMRVHLLLRKRYRYNLIRSFQLWNRNTKALKQKDHCIELLRFRSLKQLKIRAFYGLREGIIQEKMDLFQTKIKFYKKWRYHYLQRRFVKQMDQYGIDKGQSGTDLKDKQQVFNAFKMNMILNKNKRIQQHHKEQCTDIIQQCKKQIKDTHNDMQEKNSQKLKSIILRWKGLSIRPYFDYWKDIIDHYKSVKQMKLYRKLKNYKLNQAFQHWRYKSQIAQNNKQLEYIEEIENDNKQMLSEIKKISEENKSLADKSTNKGEAKAFRVIKHQFNIMKQQAFNKWKGKVDDTKRQANRLRVILAQWKLHTLRIYFQKYRKNARKLTKYQEDEVTLNRFNVVFNERLMRKYFKHLRNNAKEFKQVKRRVKILMLKKLKQSTVQAFNQWKAIANKRQLKFENQIEMQEIEQYQAVVEELCQKQTIVEQQQQHMDKCEKLLVNNSGRTIKKYLMVITKYQESKGFYAWKEEAKRFKKQKLMMRHMLLWMKRGEKEECFRRWKNEMLEKRIQIVKNRNVYLQKSTNEKSIQHMKNSKQNNTKIQQLKQTLENTNRDSNKYSKRQLQIIETFAGRKENALMYKSHHYVFRIWRQRLQNVKKQFSKVFRIAQVEAQREGFYTLMEQYSTMKIGKDEQKLDFLVEMVKLQQKMKVKIFMSRWKSLVYKENKQSIEEMNMIKQRIESLRLEQRILYKSAVNILMGSQHNDKRLFNIFHAWTTVIQEKKRKRINFESLQENILYLRQKNAINKWQKRSKHTQFYRSRIYTMRKRLELNLQKRYFMSFKNYQRSIRNKQSEIRYSLQRIVQRTLKYSFNAIQSHAKSLPITQKDLRKKSISQLFNSIEQIHNLRMKQALTTIKQYSRLHKIRKSFMARLIAIRGKDIKNAWNSWVEMVGLKNVEKEVEALGTAKLELFEENIKYNALKSLLRKQEQYKEEEINKVVKVQQRKQKQLMLKSLIRMQFYNPENFHLPKYFDILRNQAQESKIRKLKLRKALIHCLKASTPKAYGFYIWKRNIHESTKQLQSMKTKDIIEMKLKKNTSYFQDQSTLCTSIDQESRIEYQIEALEDFKAKGRALFFGYLKKRDHIVLQQAFSRWIECKSETQKEVINKEIEDKFIILNELRKRLEQLSQDNYNLRYENQSLHNQAMESMNYAETIEKLGKDRNDLTLMLADKNLQMKKLVEDNNNLNIRISNQKIIKSQIIGESLKKSSGSSPLRRKQSGYDYRSVEFK